MGLENPVHLIFIGAVALVVLGPKRLPELARALGHGIREFREAISAATEEPAAGAPAAMTPTAMTPTATASPPAATTTTPAEPPAPVVPPDAHVVSEPPAPVAPATAQTSAPGAGEQAPPEA